METKTKAATFVLKLAAKIFASYRKDWESYEAECDSYSAQGYRPRTCFHGTNLWVDYDPICGPCEDGYGWFDPMLYRHLAISDAKAAYEEFNERLDLYTKAAAKHAPVDFGKMITWVAEPLTKWDAPVPESAATTDPPF
jgi:hypothetical protein